MRLRRLAVLAVAVLFAASMSLSGALPFALAAATPDAANHGAVPEAAPPCHGDHHPADDHDGGDADHAAPGLSCCGVACHTAVPVQLVFAPPVPDRQCVEPVVADALPQTPPLRIEHPPRSAGPAAG